MKKIGIEKLILMYVIAFGEFDGVLWEVFPDMPDCFTEGLSFAGRKADFIRITVSQEGDCDCWFMYADEESFHMPLNKVMVEKPMLYAAIVTHVYDMVMELDEK